MLCNVFEHNAVNKIIYDSQFEICSTILCAFCCSWNVCEGRTDEFFDTVAGKLICWRKDRSLRIFARNLEFLRESYQKLHKFGFLQIFPLKFSILPRFTSDFEAIKPSPRGSNLKCQF